jgi:hypothetical protein
VFLPLSIANIVAVMTVLQFGINPYALFPISLGLFGLFGFFTVTAKQMEIKRRRRASLAMR